MSGWVYIPGGLQTWQRKQFFVDYCLVLIYHYLQGGVPTKQMASMSLKTVSILCYK